MAIEPGTKLGPYEITSALGAGGMGEVYRATDTRLGRTVAIKVLPSHHSENEQFRQRFEREAKTISQLSNPHICTLYDIGHENGIDFIVMEYLEGETLAQRLAKGPLPADQVLRFAIQTADALDKAHKLGIVHRDLKPGNIMLTKSGVKLLDFGLAKLQANPAASSATAASALPTEEPDITGEGSILGTVPYMAPEQLEGKDADSRTDIFAFGVTLYEMITGKKAFTGKSQASLIAAILEKEPQPMSELQPMTPPALERVVKTCLAKDPDDRWQSAHDLKNELAWIRDGSSQGQMPAAVASHRRKLPRWAWGLAGLIAGALLTGAPLFLTPGTKSSTNPITRLTITLPPTDRLKFDVVSHSIAISPDGQSLVYSARRGDTTSLYLRKMDEYQAQPIPGTQGGDNPFFSPDGQWVLFWSGGWIKKVTPGAGAPVNLLKSGDFLGASWTRDHKIFIGNFARPVLTITETGEALKVVATPDPKAGEGALFTPEALPNGKGILFQKWSSNPDHRWAIVAQSFATGERKVLVNDAHDARYVPTGHLVYEQDGSLFAAPFDQDNLELTGTPVRLSERVATYQGGALALYSIAGNGTLAYVPGGTIIPDRNLVWVDRSGKETPASSLQRLFVGPSLSPDGKTIVALQLETYDLWKIDLSRDAISRLTTYGDERSPIWSPDGKRVYYISSEDKFYNIYSLPVDGSSSAEQLTRDQQPREQIATSCSPDGKLLALNRKYGGTTNADIWILHLDGDKTLTPFATTAFNERDAVFSPDGKTIAFVSDESGTDQVYVQPFPGEGGRTPVSTDGGRYPRWSRNGQEVFYRKADQVMAVSITTQPSLAASRPVVLFRGDYVSDSDGWGAAGGTYDVAPDGRFLMVKEVSHEPFDHINIVLNWFEEIKQAFQKK